MNWWFQRKSDPRLFVELLFKVSAFYANPPSSQLELGDYGDVNKKTGEFIKLGNVLEEYPELRLKLGEARQTPEARKHYFAARSDGNAVAVDVSAKIPEIADCSLKLGWEIHRDRHAALIMIDPVLQEFEYEGRLRPFILSKPDLMDKAVVTKVYRCATFARLLTNGRAGQIYVGFHAETTLPTGVPVEVGVGAHQVWRVNSQVGEWSTGNYDPGNYQYSPLAKLRQVRPEFVMDGFRERPPPPITDPDREGMIDYYPPWGELNEKGKDIDDKEDVEEP